MSDTRKRRGGSATSPATEKVADTHVVTQQQPIVHDSVIFMTVQTRRRGEAKAKVALLAKVDHSVKRKVEAIATTLGVSQAAAVEMMLQSIEVDANGRPTFWTGPLPTDANEELPLVRSA